MYNIKSMVAYQPTQKSYLSLANGNMRISRGFFVNIPDIRQQNTARLQAITIKDESR